VVTPTGAANVDTRATTTAHLLADRQALAAAAASTDTVPVDSLDLRSPVTTPCRLIAQMTNFASHVVDTGGSPASVPLTFFRKSSGSICGPQDDVIRPAHVRLLDYEVEIGLVIGKEVPVGTTIVADTLAEYIAGVVVANDGSARDIQLPQTQFYEAKCPNLRCPTAPATVGARSRSAPSCRPTRRSRTWSPPSPAPPRAGRA
jgi:2-keto-4-pentenoate hydratase/2-oxohepta-3-ene-1,7-dioic acid hydratase in catechol pathway